MYNVLLKFILDELPCDVEVSFHKQPNGTLRVEMCTLDSDKKWVYSEDYIPHVHDLLPDTIMNVLRVVLATLQQKKEGAV